MIRKATLIMERHSQHVHSNRFNAVEVDRSQTTAPSISDDDASKILKNNWYLTKPLADGAKKIRVTVEVIE